MSSFMGDYEREPSPIKRDEPRIKQNLTRLIDANAEYNHLAHRTEAARHIVENALADLKAAGGIEEGQNYHGIGVHVKPRSIDTAPRDGTRIMIFDAEKQLWGFGSWAPGEDIDGPFTHWMPSPQPPLENMG